jgi:hypothetical protein
MYKYIKSENLPRLSKQDLSQKGHDYLSLIAIKAEVSADCEFEVRDRGAWTMSANPNVLVRDV